MTDEQSDAKLHHSATQPRAEGSTKFAAKPGAPPKPKLDERARRQRRAEKARSKAEGRFWALVENPATPAEIVARSLAELRKMGSIPDNPTIEDPGLDLKERSASLMVAAGYARQIGGTKVTWTHGSGNKQRTLQRIEGGRIESLISDAELAEKAIESAAAAVSFAARGLDRIEAAGVRAKAIMDFAAAVEQR